LVKEGDDFGRFSLGTNFRLSERLDVDDAVRRLVETVRRFTLAGALLAQ
jgi:hypothetical protein